MSVELPNAHGSVLSAPSRTSATTFSRKVGHSMANVTPDTSAPTPTNKNLLTLLSIAVGLSAGAIVFSFQDASRIRQLEKEHRTQFYVLNRRVMALEENARNGNGD